MNTKPIKVVRPGHHYFIPNIIYEGQGQVIQFLEEDEEILTDGMSNEQVIEMLIDRIEYLDGRFPLGYNQTCLSHLRAALDALRALDNRGGKIEV